MEPAGSVARRRGSQVDAHFPADNPEKLRFSGIIVTGAAGHLRYSFQGFWNHLEASASCQEGALNYVIPDHR
jgi:hypothetical protein